MKKLIAIVLALLIILSFAACGSDNTDTPSESGNETTQQTDTTEEKTDASEDEDPTVLDLCGLTVDDIKTSAGNSLGEAIETPVQYIVPVFCADTSAETFAGWVNELADNCRKAAKDGSIYADEFKTEPLTEFDFDPEALINMVQFVYKTEGHIVYVTAADSGSVENAFSCNIQVY